MEYYSCYFLEQMYLTFKGRIDDKYSSIALCCETTEGAPTIPYEETPEETLKNIVDKWKQIMEDSQQYGNPPPPSSVSFACSKCPLYRKAEWKPDGLIHAISLAVYPSPCQCRCIYCHVYETYDNVTPTSRTAEAYERLFGILERIKESGMLAPDFAWQVTCGEISIHPYKKRFLELIEGRPALFFTNGFRYDEGIAQHLHENPKSCLFLSIDAGIPETWHKVKGVNNFETVLSNLTKYYHQSAPGQIRLKYIVLPGINDTWEDYVSVVDIAKALKVQAIEISRDHVIKSSMSPKERITLVSAAAYLLALCQKNDIPVALFDLNYTLEEQEQMQQLAQEILERGLPD